MAKSGPGGAMVLKPGPNGTFKPLGRDAVTLSFTLAGQLATKVAFKQFTAEYSYRRVEAKEAKEQPTLKSAEEKAGLVASPINWPSFRGPNASGIADGQHPPTTWDTAKGTNVRWKTPIPGLGHSCPIIWGDRIFLTTAISSKPDQKVRTGLYGDVTSVNDLTPHTWKVYCVDRNSGKILWERIAFQGVPKFRRHLKGSQANCTPATDGRHVIACFGSEGLYCYDFEGKLLWKRDLGVLDTSFIVFPENEWGFGSSPIIYKDLVLLQCDLSKDSFIAAYSIEDGNRVWSTPRDEIPSWSTPTIWQTPKGVELVTNAAQYARGYDPATGKELWRLAKKSEVTVPTPFVARAALCDQRQPAHSADLCHPARLGRRHFLERRRDAQCPDRLGQDARRAVHADADCLWPVPLRLLQRGHRDVLRGRHGQGDLQRTSRRRP